MNMPTTRVSLILLLLLFITAPFVQTASHVYSFPSGNTAPYVEYTLDLSNNTLLAGNALPVNSSSGPFDIALDTSNGYLYAADYRAGNIAVINGATNKVLTTIEVGGYPYAVDFDSFNGYLYVALSTGSIAVINGATNKVVTTIAIQPINGPSSIAFNPSNGNLYVSNGWNVEVIDCTTNKVVGAVEEFGGYGEAYALAFDPSNGYLYMATYIPPSGSIHDLPYVNTNNVLAVNGTTNNIVTATAVAENGQPYGLAFDSRSGYLYMTNYDSSNMSGVVSVINGPINAVVATTAVSGGVYAVDSDSNGYLYLTNSYLNGTVSVINSTTNNIVRAITVGNIPLGVIFDPLNGDVYVTNEGSGTISIIWTGAAPTTTSNNTTALQASTSSTTATTRNTATSTTPPPATTNKAVTHTATTPTTILPSTGVTSATARSSDSSQKGAPLLSSFVLLATAATIVVVAVGFALMARRRRSSTP